MPNPGATAVKGYDALDLGRGDDGIWRIATRYSDGSYVVWNAEGDNEELAYIGPGEGLGAPVDVGGGRAVVVNPDMSLTAFPIANPPPQFAGQAPQAPAPAAPGAPPAPGTPTGPIGTRRPGEDFNYGPTRPGAGVYPNMPGQTVRPGATRQGQTTSAGTWNPAMPSQGRGEGWGSIGAGTEGIPYGWGTPGFNQNPIKINEADLPYLFNDKPGMAPGYIPGSGTYNQYRLDAESQKPRFPGAPTGLFGPIGPKGEIYNTRFGLGGTGDPTTGGELQTPQRYITGVAGDSGTAMQGDAAWRAKYGGGGMGGGGEGGGWDQAWVGSAAGRYAPGPGVSSPGGSMNASGFGASGWEYVQPGVDVRRPGGGMGGGGGEGYNPGYTPYSDGMGGGGMGGGFFGSTVTSNWGQTAETAGKDYIATLFLRSDTPTGIGTPAYAAPQAFWDGLAQEIAAGRIYVKDPMAWQMLAEKGYTPQKIGGAATGGQNVQPGGSAGLGDAAANAAAAAAADRAAYWAYQQALLRQGDQRIALEEARDAWNKTYQTASLSGQLNGQDTMAMQEQKYQQGVTDAGLTGTYQGQDTMAKINQQNAQAQALLALQAQMQGPRNWAAYQKTFGATPQGLKDVMSAYMGRYQLPTGQGAQNTAQGGVQSVAGLGGDILSGTYGQDGQSGMSTMNPRQASVSNWARMMPSQREMILGNYEQQGWYAPDVEKLIQGAAPKYSGPQTGSYNFFQG